MSYHVGPPLPVPHDHGYSCQAWSPLEVYEELFGTANRRAWFSLAFNPALNADSSNPCWLYTELSRAVQQNDVGSKLIMGYGASLLQCVTSREKDLLLSSADADTYRDRITRAPVASFRPQVWKLDLNTIRGRPIHTGKTVDEVLDIFRKNAQNEVKPPQALQPDEFLILTST
ncbi:MAG: hypothetical protein HYY01_11125 [Chloroflexi bacterium]|nr:hypothetical protein [Chloroflexota bacterium]